MQYFHELQDMMQIKLSVCQLQELNLENSGPSSFRAIQHRRAQFA